MSIEFKKIDGKLILVYTPAMGTDDITRRLSTEEGVQIKNTFHVTDSLLYETDEAEDEWEETLRFCIGVIDDGYIQLDSEVFGTNHSFYISNEIKLKPQMFTAYRNISIIGKIDEVIERDFYIGGDWETHNGISKETFENLISKFPKTAELDKYAHMRIASIIKDYFPECDK